MKHKSRSVRTNRIMAILIALPLLVSSAIALRVVKRLDLKSKSSVGTRLDNHSDSKRETVNPNAALDSLTQQQTSGQFDLSRNVIAGGGGTSAAGNFRIDGTVGEVSASNSQSGGSFTVAGGSYA